MKKKAEEKVKVYPVDLSAGDLSIVWRLLETVEVKGARSALGVAALVTKLEPLVQQVVADQKK